jgi:hypothetical protein
LTFPAETAAEEDTREELEEILSINGEARGFYKFPSIFSTFFNGVGGFKPPKLNLLSLI